MRRIRVRLNIVEAVRIVFYSLIGAYGVIPVTMLLDALISPMLRFPGRESDFLFWGPSFVVPIALGAAWGWRVRGKITRVACLFLPLIPLLLAVYEIHIFWIHDLHQPTFWQVIYDNFWGKACEGSECGEEVIITTPLVSSVACCIVAFVANNSPEGLKYLYRARRSD